MLDCEKKHQREAEEKAEKARKVQETMGVLNWQNDQKSAVSKLEKERKLKEQEMLRQQWEIEHQNEKEADRQKFILNRERNIELLNHNAAERELRLINEQAAKNRDKELLAAALAKEKAIQDLEEQERQARRAEIVELQGHYKKSKDDKAQYEKLVDQFVEQEAER